MLESFIKIKEIKVTLSESESVEGASFAEVIITIELNEPEGVKELLHADFHYSQMLRLAEELVTKQGRLVVDGAVSDERVKIETINDGFCLNAEEDSPNTYIFHQYLAWTPVTQAILEEINILANGGELNYRTTDSQILALHLEVLSYYWD